MITKCTLRSNGDDGIHVEGTGSYIFDNICDGNNTGEFSSGIVITQDSTDNRIERNLLISNAQGIRTDGSSSGNLIIRNSASGNTTNYDTQPGNFVGTVVSTETAMNAAPNDLVNIEF